MKQIQFVSVSGSNSKLDYGVPQRSVLGPVLFVLFLRSYSTTPVRTISFADDTQLRKSCSPEHYDDTRSALQTCTSDIKDWMTENKLQLNADKTETMLFNFLKTQASTCTSFDLASHHFLPLLSQKPWFLPRQGFVCERTLQFHLQNCFPGNPTY